MERINIRSDSPDWRGAILSNLAPTPFIAGGIMFPSVESALQGIKFADLEKRRQIFSLDGLGALREGRKITRELSDGKASHIFWDGQIMEYNSIEHRLLIALFIAEKVRQNPKVQEALLATSGTFIYHEVGGENPRTSLPEKFYMEILISQRKLLKRLISLK